MKYFCIGNSHSNFFTGSHPATMGESRRDNFVSFCIGPTVAYHFYDHHLPKLIEYLEGSDIDKDTDYVMLVVGEVDCRWHLPKQAELQGRTVIDVTHECLVRYCKCILDLKDRGYKMIGWCGHPSTNKGHDDNPNSPIYGDVYTRNTIGEYWDNHIAAVCAFYGIPLISIYHDLVNDDGTTKMEYFLDYCHLSQAAFPFLEEQLKKLSL